MCGNLQHMFNILRMFEEIGSDNESEEPNGQNVHLKKKKVTTLLSVSTFIAQFIVPWKGTLQYL